MTIKKTSWFLFISLALVGFFIWLNVFYPRFSRINLSVDRQQALTLAKDYLVKRTGLDPASYQSAIIFTSDEIADRYLQKTIGFLEEEKFIEKHDYTLFFWIVRFFKEKQKEELRLILDSRSGEIIGFKHILDDAAPRTMVSEEEAKETAIQFLKATFHFNERDYSIYTKSSQKYDARTDHSFAWEKKGVLIPWSKEKDSGGARLLMSAVVSGDEILSFNKVSLSIPDQFNRFIENQKEAGRNLSLVFRIFYLWLLAGSIMLVIHRCNHLAMHSTKRFYIAIALVLFVLSILENINYFQVHFFDYPTTQPLFSYITRQMIYEFLDAFFMVLMFMMPCLAGESLSYELNPQQKHGRLVHYIHSTFLSRTISQQILLGYLVAVIMLGIQSLAFHFGYKYFGVWVEQAWLTQLSTSYFPFLAALTVGLKASFMEEATYRLFAINWFIKMWKRPIFAVLITSLIWGFGHAGYLIFPMWFRGIEVTCMGIFLSMVYLRYGIIAVVVGHFLFDAFWGSAGHLLGHTNALHFYSSLGVILLPLLLGIIAWAINRCPSERPMTWRMTKVQQFNAEILRFFLTYRLKKGEDPQKLRDELTANGWDTAVIDTVLRDNRPAT